MGHLVQAQLSFENKTLIMQTHLGWSGGVGLGGTLECAPPQGLRFNSTWCQFEWANLAS